MKPEQLVPDTVPGVTDPALRPLTDREKEILAHLLAADFAGRDALVAQSRVVSVLAQWPGEPSIDLVVTEGDAPLAEVAFRVPVEASTLDNSAEILMHVVDGLLSTLELVSSGAMATPDEFPPVGSLTPPRALPA